MSKDSIFTGAYTLPVPGDSTRQFGLVACESPPDRPGQLTLTLRHRDTGIAATLDDTCVSLSIPEELSLTAVRVVDGVLTRIVQLRTAAAAKVETPTTRQLTAVLLASDAERLAAVQGDLVLLELLWARETTFLSTFQFAVHSALLGEPRSTLRLPARAFLDATYKVLVKRPSDLVHLAFSLPPDGQALFLDDFATSRHSRTDVTAQLALHPDCPRLRRSPGWTDAVVNLYCQYLLNTQSAGRVSLKELLPLGLAFDPEASRSAILKAVADGRLAESERDAILAAFPDDADLKEALTAP